ncbi:uncharacterized protein (UPF0335 family) [Rhizobium skierniewicense]|uniref:UPF0335 protein GGQ73_003040 n=1 Tax=Rhizobium skierniewicense TaxID=984260 RepID=A0A7W6G422_9HYPH|nr:uncharacterized protein (UPF0335 family) [Rhizobium skierniewicense]
MTNLNFTIEQKQVPVLKEAARKLTDAARGKAHNPTLPGQIEAFDRDETGEAATETVAAAELRSIIERVERLEEEKSAISDDIKDVMGEAKGRGYDTKAIRTIIRLRKKDANERIEEESILQTYMAALGME